MTPGSPNDRQTKRTTMIVTSPSAAGAHGLRRKAAIRAGCHVHDRAVRPTIESPKRIATARHALRRTLTGRSGALAAEHHVLGAGWYTRQSRLERSEQRERTWKDKKKVGRHDVESRAVQQLSSVAGPQRLPVPVPRGPAHDPSCARLPPVVLPA